LLAGALLSITLLVERVMVKSQDMDKLSRRIKYRY